MWFQVEEVLENGRVSGKGHSNPVLGFPGEAGKHLTKRTVGGGRITIDADPDVEGAYRGEVQPDTFWGF